MIDVAIVVALVFALAVATAVLLRVQSVGRVALLDWSLLAIAGGYGAGWSLVIAVTAAGNNPFWFPWILADVHQLLVHTAAAIILSGFLWFGWVVAGSILLRNHLASRHVIAPVRSLNSIEVRLNLSAWTMLLTAVVLQVVYSHAYGGLAGVLTYANSLRSGIFEIYNQWSFLKPLTGLVFFASFIFYGLILSPVQRHPWFGFVLSFIFSIYLLYSWFGRIGFLAYLATFVLSGILYRRSKPVSVLVLGAAILGSMLVAAYYLSFALNLKFIDGLPAYLASELSFPFASFFGHLQEGPHQFRWFIDFAALPLYFLPSSLWIDWFEDVSRVNTILIMGAAKGEAGVTGGIPVDLLTLGLLQASIMGVAVVGAVFGVFLRACQFFVDRIPHTGVRLVVTAHLALKLAILGVFYAQPDLIVRENIHLMVGAVMLAAFAGASPHLGLRRITLKSQPKTIKKSTL